MAHDPRNATSLDRLRRRLGKIPMELRAAMAIQARRRGQATPSPVSRDEDARDEDAPTASTPAQADQPGDRPAATADAATMTPAKPHPTDRARKIAMTAGLAATIRKAAQTFNGKGP